MTAVTSNASIPSIGLIFILLFGLIRPCIAGGADQPEQIIRKMYSDLLNRNFAGDITAKNNRAKYFMPSLVRLYDASEFVKDSGRWKISDVILPWGQRLSQITCSQSAKPL